MGDAVAVGSQVISDPTVTRLVRRRVTVGDSALLEVAGTPIAASVSVIVPVPNERAIAGLDSALRWQPDRLRVEAVATVSTRALFRPAVLSSLRDSGGTWRLVDQPLGGRIAAIDAAVSAAAYEFIVVTGQDWSGETDVLDAVPSTLMAMWSQGADLALVGSRDGVVDGGSGVDDPAARLVAAMGLVGGQRSAGVVVMRRWVARWILDDATRAIAPADEVADRLRLLGAAILVVDV